MQKKKESFAKKSEGVEALKDKVVSDGTLKPEDLIPKFLNALKHDETAHSKFLKDNPEILEIQSWDDVDDETKSMLVDELTDALNDIAPDGYFFGATIGLCSRIGKRLRTVFAVTDVLHSDKPTLGVILAHPKHSIGGRSVMA